MFQKNPEDSQSAFTMSATEDDHGKRFDIFTAENLSDVSRSHVAELIGQGSILLNGQKKKPGSKVRSGDLISGRIPPPPPLDFIPENLDLSILYEDDAIIVINKQAGIVVHPAPGHFSGTLVNGLLYHFPGIETAGEECRPGIVHRLDRDTSGVMVVAKTRKAHAFLSGAFKKRQVYKRYAAIVYGIMEPDSGIITGMIGRHPTDRKKMSVTPRYGRYAETHWQVRERFGSATAVFFEIKTGRTHQIRVHSTSIGHPLVGDPVYTGNYKTTLKKAEKRLIFVYKSVGRQMLHAEKIEFCHPETSEKISFTAPLPQDMQDLIDKLR